jgi:uncharacterized RDD family membrane protein YckC
MALLIDLIACYIAAIMISTLISLIPILNRVLFLNQLFSQKLCLILLFMSRDYFFAGHGIGKNLMGLQVVGIDNRLPISLWQSCIRNLPLVAPVMISEVISFLPIAWITNIVSDICNILEAIYVIIVFPLESYRAYNRQDSRRLGDMLAHTCLIEAPTNFDNFLPTTKS